MVESYDFNTDMGISIVPVIMSLVVLFPQSIFGQQEHVESWDNGIERSLVFCPGDYGSKFYRIPAIVTASDGSLVALADKRIETNGDLPAKIDVVSRRSVDGGRTWSKYVTVACHDSTGGCGDASLVMDRRSGDILAIYNQGNGIFQGDTPARIKVVRSNDNGISWKKAIDITDQIITADTCGHAPVKCVGAFATSGRATQLSDGRIIIALVVREKDNPFFKTYAVYSDDGGYSWDISGNPVSKDGDESKIAELPDGSLLMSIRNRFGTLRKFSRSTDRGATWSEPLPAEDLPDPRCNGDLIAYENGRDYLLLQSLPDNPKNRENVSIFVSYDGGKTWPMKKRIVTMPSAYSSMTILPNGDIGILTEESSNGHYSYNIWFTRLPVEYVINGESVSR